MNTREFLLTSWSLHLPVLLTAACAIAIYAILWKTAAPANAGSRWKIIYFILALALFLFTFLSPLNTLAQGYLFSAHMAQHILLVLLIPAFLLLGLPSSFHFPKSAPRLAPILGWIAGIAAMWVWHLPALCNAAASSQSVFVIQSISLVVLGSLFWWPVLNPQGSQRINPLAGIVYLFTACSTCTVLGIILTFSPVSMCSVYTHPVDSLGMLSTIQNTWGLTSAKDQQLGGLLMWVPMCLIYLVAVFGQLVRWYQEDVPTAGSTPTTSSSNA